MFDTLDTIDWSAMHHAYGPAGRVPALLRDLISDDPDTREYALDDMYGSVHHQGTVYECTLAVIPFLLEIAADPEVPGRAEAVRLLASIGGVDVADMRDYPLPEPGYPLAVRARRAVAEAAPEFADLLSDDDSEVRRAAVSALLADAARAERTAGLLRDRYPRETDPDVRAEIITVLGWLNRSVPLTDWLAERADREPDPAQRITVLTALARRNSGAGDSDPVPAVLESLRELYGGTESAAPISPVTDTLIGAIRAHTEKAAAQRRGPAAPGLLHDFGEALGDRVADRCRLLTDLLREPAWEPRLDATRAAWRLLQHWRGDHAELVALVGGQLLDDGDPRLRAAAVRTLRDVDALAAPAADTLAGCVAEAPREADFDADGPPPWFEAECGELLVGPVLHALARLRDPRALPALRWGLQRPRLPRYLGYLVDDFGPGAAELVPVIRERLRELAELGGDAWQHGGLVAALAGIGEAAADAVDELLLLPPDGAVLRALGRVGAGAAETVVPVVRRAFAAGGASEVTAARTLWRLGCEPGLVLPALLRQLSDGGPSADGAAWALAELGPAAEEAAPLLRELLDPTRDTDPWTPLAAASALWKITGDAETALPVLTASWSQQPHMRRGIAETFADMGPRAAPVLPLVREELDRPKRHNASDTAWSSDQVRTDLTLLRGCHAALAGCATA